MGRLDLGEVLRLATGLGRIAMAAQVLADGLADAGAARLALLLDQLMPPPLQIGFDAHTQGNDFGVERCLQR